MKKTVTISNVIDEAFSLSMTIADFAEQQPESMTEELRELHALAWRVWWNNRHNSSAVFSGANLTDTQ